MRIGVFCEAANRGTIDDVVAAVHSANDDGFDSIWVPQIFGHDALTLMAIAGREVPRIEIGTAVVPTFPRHPMMLAQQALTVNAASAGRFCLGIGLSHKIVVEAMWGMSFDKPVRHMREYLQVLMPLLESSAVRHRGESFNVTGALSIKGASRPGVVLAALGEQMLRVAGTLADGTLTWCTGPRTLHDHVIPVLGEAAEQAGRPAPRTIATLPVCVTDKPDEALARAAKIFEMYGQLPSYRAMLDREGVEGPEGVAIVGSEDQVHEQIAHLRSIGVSDFVGAEFGADEDERARTRQVLKSNLGA